MVVLFHLLILLSEVWGGLCQNDSSTEEVNVRFTLFNRKLGEDGAGVKCTDSDEYLRKVWMPDRPTKVTVHGWLGSERSIIVTNITQVYVEEQDVNAVRVDWSGLAGNYMYHVSAMNVEAAGRAVGSLVARLRDVGVAPPDAVHLVGHSLGAHVMGIAGEYLNGTVARITGLDPARPGFEVAGLTSGRLDPADAKFVDVIHSAAGAAGYLTPLGHADFFPNGGAPPMPGCFSIVDPTSIVGCSHSRSWEYFMESIKKSSKKFRAVQCPDWASFAGGTCKQNSPVYMGDPAPSTARGLFYLFTSSQSPYALG